MYKIDNKYQKQRLKVCSRDWIFKNTILKKRRRRGKKNEKTNKTNKKNTKPQELLKIIIREIEYLKI